MNERLETAFIVGWASAKREDHRFRLLDWVSGILCGAAMGLLIAAALSSHWQTGGAVVLLIVHHALYRWRRGRPTSETALAVQIGLRALQRSRQ